MHIDADTLRHLPQGLQTLIENANPPPPASTEPGAGVGRRTFLNVATATGLALGALPAGALAPPAPLMPQL